MKFECSLFQELTFPLIDLGNYLIKLFNWEEPSKSVAFCLIFGYIIYRGWLSYVFALLLIFIASSTMLTRYTSRGQPIDELKVMVPPPMNKMEQLLAVQNAISQAEEFVQEGNVVLLKIRGLLLSLFPQASNRFVAALVALALFVAITPFKYVVLITFLEEFTKYSPMRRAETERWIRRLREWWFSIPAAPVIVERTQEDKKKK
nr:hypothetical protein CTI12_AA033400 [Tanacetum cinerariifolium]